MRGIFSKPVEIAKLPEFLGVKINSLGKIQRWVKMDSANVQKVKLSPNPREKGSGKNMPIDKLNIYQKLRITEIFKFSDRFFIIFVLFALLIIPNMAGAQGTEKSPAIEALNPYKSINIVRGCNVVMESRIEVVFKKGSKSFLTLKDEVLPYLVDDPIIDCPPKLKIEITSLNVEKSRIYYSTDIFSTDILLGDGYSIHCKIKISSVDDILPDHYNLTISLPAVNKIAKIIEADDLKQTPTYLFDVYIFESKEALSKKQETEKKEEEKLKAEREKNEFVRMLEGMWESIKGMSKGKALLVCLVTGPISGLLIWFFIWILRKPKDGIYGERTSGGSSGLGFIFIIALLMAFFLAAFIMSLIRVIFIWP